MHRFMKLAGLALAALAVIGVSTASAQVVQVYYPAPVISAPVVSYYASPPVYMAPAPTVTYYQPAYQPVTVYSAPAPAVAYYQPAAVYTPGVVTTRSFVGFGIFRPRGVYTQSYYSPGYVSSYRPGVVTYYTPGYLR